MLRGQKHAGQLLAFSGVLRFRVCFGACQFGTPHLPKDPAILKTLRDSQLLCRSVFATPPPPYLLHSEPFLERRDACKTRENDVRARGSR